MYLFTSEVVSAGHPDKCADIIADSIVDRFISGDRDSRVASEVFVAGKNVIIGGEIKSKVKLSLDDYRQIVESALVDIGYRGDGYFSRDETIYPDDIDVQVLLNAQSPDLSQGVDREDGEIGAGEQGYYGLGYAGFWKQDWLYWQVAIYITARGNYWIRVY